MPLQQNTLEWRIRNACLLHDNLKRRVFWPLRHDSLEFLCLFVCVQLSVRLQTHLIILSMWMNNNVCSIVVASQFHSVWFIFLLQLMHVELVSSRDSKTLGIRLLVSSRDSKSLGIRLLLTSASDFAWTVGVGVTSWRQKTKVRKREITRVAVTVVKST